MLLVFLHCLLLLLLVSVRPAANTLSDWKGVADTEQIAGKGGKGEEGRLEQSCSERESEQAASFAIWDEMRRERESARRSFHE